MPISGRRLSARPEENIGRVLKRTKIVTRNVYSQTLFAVEFRAPLHSIMRRDLNQDPYNIMLIQEVKPIDDEQRIKVARGIQGLTNKDGNILHH